MTSAEEARIHAVSPESAFSGAGAASAAGACAATSCTYSAVPPASMRRQIRRTGRIFFMLLISNDIVVSFHPLAEDEVANTFVDRFQPGLFMNACYTVSSHYLTRPKLFSFALLDGLSVRLLRPYEKPRGLRSRTPRNGIHE